MPRSASEERVTMAALRQQGPLQGELRKELVTCLQQGKSSRRPRAGGADRRGQIPELVSIHVRPPEVDDRLMPGHREGDLIKGANNRSA